MSRLEAAGGVRAAEAAVDPTRSRPPTRAYAAERDAAIPAGPRRPAPVAAASAAPASGVKCLHAHYAYLLAGGDDPVGRWVARRTLDAADTPSGGGA